MQRLQKTKKKPIKNTANQPPREKRLMVMLLLLILAVAYLFLSQLSSDTTVKPSTQPAALTTQVEAVALNTNISDDIDKDNANNTNSADSNKAVAIIENTDSPSNIPTPKAILEAPLPMSNHVAKEEVDRLADEYERLKQQEELAAEQVLMTQHLTQMKAEQIALLEQQIAQLEAAQMAQ